MHAYGYSQTSDFQEALWKVIICPDRYPLTNINARCSVFATHLYFWNQSFNLVNCQNSASLKNSPESKVL